MTSRSNISAKITWLLILGFALFLVMMSISCGGDIVGPQFEDVEEDEDPNEQDGNPVDEGGSAISKVFEIPLSEFDKV